MAIKRPVFERREKLQDRVVPFHGSRPAMLPNPKSSLDLATKKAWTLVDEFKAFAFKGNVVDLAIGVIIGGSFHSIVDSMVKNVMMPLFAILIPGQRPYTHWQFTARGSTVHIGLFLADIVHFLIMAAVLFLFLVKFLGWLMRTKKEEIATIPPMTKDQELLAEIRDLLKDRSQIEPSPRIASGET